MQEISLKKEALQVNGEVTLAKPPSIAPALIVTTKLRHATIETKSNFGRREQWAQSLSIITSKTNRHS